ncbi:MAG TPA: 7TM diverse intracellular signaling domain-containing protein [Chryseolinea sp.]|nr:7TM diverse intracellular signaling domain-containing protein [Chryseolinea sp.]HPH45699.1 7TM diverse intracellular signaling domain-containing protein [Chryseolinea sp.]HPM29300.1 7TM diverse intracellular signaling domain-containing protein [Chryseolinea sp.]
MNRKFFAIVIFSLSSIAAFAQQLHLIEKGRIEVEGRMQHLVDKTGALTIMQVHALPMKALPDPTTSPNFGFNRFVHWFKLEITNNSRNEDWLLEIPFAPLDQVDFYLQTDSDTAWIHKVSGDLFKMSGKDAHHRSPVFTFSILPDEHKTIYLRVKTVSSVQVPITIWQSNVFFQASSRIQIINGMFYGAMLIMVLYQFFLAFQTRELTTIYYVFTLVAMTNVVAFFQGYNFLYLHPEDPDVNDLFAIVTGPAFVLFSTLLTRSFLNLRTFNKWLDNLLLGNMFLDIVCALLMLIYVRKISYEYHYYFVVMHCVLVLISAYYCLKKNYKPALYYLLAWIAPLLATTVFSMSSLGLVPGYLSTNYVGLMFGSLLQVLFISFALGERWTNVFSENQSMQEKELRREQEEKEHLEREVRLRTEEIQSKNERLEEVNNIKDKLFSIVSHDIKGPLTSLQLALTLAKSGDVSPAEFKKLAYELELRLTYTNEFISNLLQWAKLQLGGSLYQPEKIDLSSIAAETLVLFEPEINIKRISVEYQLPALHALADLNMIRSMMRNLITNAVKFTGIEGSITVKGWSKESEIVFSIADTGVGIPKAHQERMFTLSSVTTQGTQREKGTGLGLLLCKEFVEKNGGRIWFESEEGKGTTFYFSLPHAQGEGAPVRTEMITENRM